MNQLECRARARTSRELACCDAESDADADMLRRTIDVAQ
jgi:hypothetical protein